jgi:hypothetical protein
MPLRNLKRDGQGRTWQIGFQFYQLIPPVSLTAINFYRPALSLLFFRAIAKLAASQSVGST